MSGHETAWLRSHVERCLHDVGDEPALLRERDEIAAAADRA